MTKSKKEEFVTEIESSIAGRKKLSIYLLTAITIFWLCAIWIFSIPAPLLAHASVPTLFFISMMIIFTVVNSQAFKNEQKLLSFVKSHD